MHEFSMSAGRFLEWFGPNTIFQVLKKLCRYDDWSGITTFVALDNCVVTEEIMKLCEKDDNTWAPLLLIIPLRLGLSEINPIYIDGLKKSFEIPGTCGLVGGRPNQAHYFIGYVGDEALYLDPHTTQKCGSIGEKITQNEIDLDCSYHQKYAARIQFEKMDPSLALSFLCRTREEFTELCTRLRDDICGGNQPPLFEIVTTGQTPWRRVETNKQTNAIKANMDDDSEDEFEFI